MTPSRTFSGVRPSIENWICPKCRLHRANRERVSYSTSLARQTRNPSLIGKSKVSVRRHRRQSYFSTTSARLASTRQPVLPEGPARTRFAPSPTGYLHIGGLRTALFSFLLAKRTGGQFLLRIEDTDQKRLVPDAELKLCNDLQWAGLRWDEGPDVSGPHGPYRQSERNQIYHKHSQQLLAEGSAYRCFCTQQSSGGSQNAYVTSGCYQDCSSLSGEESQERAEDGKQAFTVRLRPLANAHRRTYPDLVYGKIQRLKRSPASPQTVSEDDTSAQASDTILIKSDGTPTYHFANVVDDHLMQITHVIRGLEWMASTPLHYDIYSAFGWERPKFAHVGLLVDQNKAKLSKRNQDLALDVRSMRDQHGVLPYTLNNFLVLLGWTNPTDYDVMDMEALIRNFDLKFTKGNAMVRTEKLWFLQKQHVALRCQEAQSTASLKPIKDIVEQITHEVRQTFAAPFINADLFSEVYYSEQRDNADALAAYCTEILLADSKAYHNAKEFVERNKYFFAFESTQIPPEPEYYNKAQTLGAADLQLLTKLTLYTLDVERPFDDGLSKQNDLDSNEQETKASPVEGDTLMSTQTLERVYHASLAEAMWSATIGHPPHFRFAFVKPEETAFNFPEFLSTRPPYTAKPVDVQTQALALCQDTVVVTDVEGTAASLAQRYKALNGALMKYLREKLAYGQPGPSMSMVIALLGRRECCRRLGIPLNERGKEEEEERMAAEDVESLAKKFASER